LEWMRFFPHLKGFCKKNKEESFYTAVICDGKLLYCFECGLKNEEKSCLQYAPDEIYENLAVEGQNFKIIYYSKKCNWVAWFSSECDVGIFAFEDGDIAKLFSDEMERRDLYTPEEVVELIWHHPKKDIAEKFLKIYKPMAFPLEPGHRGQSLP